MVSFFILKQEIATEVLLITSRYRTIKYSIYVVHIGQLNVCLLTTGMAYHNRFTI